MRRSAAPVRSAARERRPWAPGPAAWILLLGLHGIIAPVGVHAVTPAEQQRAFQDKWDLVPVTTNQAAIRRELLKTAMVEHINDEQYQWLRTEDKHLQEHVKLVTVEAIVKNIVKNHFATAKCKNFSGGVDDPPTESCAKYAAVVGNARRDVCASCWWAGY